MSITTTASYTVPARDGVGPIVIKVEVLWMRGRTALTMWRNGHLWCEGDTTMPLLDHLRYMQIPARYRGAAVRALAA